MVSNSLPLKTTFTVYIINSQVVLGELCRGVSTGEKSEELTAENQTVITTLLLSLIQNKINSSSFESIFGGMIGSHWGASYLSSRLSVIY